MWDLLLDFGDEVGSIGEFVVELVRGMAQAEPSAFDDREPDAGPPVPEPPPPRLPDTGWDDFTPVPKAF